MPLTKHLPPPPPKVEQPKIVEVPNDEVIDVDVDIDIGCGHNGYSGRYHICRRAT